MTSSYLGLGGRLLELRVIDLDTTSRSAAFEFGCSLGEIALVCGTDILNSNDEVPPEGVINAIRVEDEADEAFLGTLGGSNWDDLSLLDVISIDRRWGGAGVFGGSCWETRGLHNTLQYSTRWGQTVWPSLTAIPGAIGIRCSALKNLSISCTNITELPPEIGRLTSLEELCLSFNKLSILPVELRDLKSLSHLDISKNEIETIVSPFQIQELRASDNKIKTAGDVFQYPRLSRLYIGGNRIKKLQSSSGHPSIVDIYAERNPDLHFVSPLLLCQVRRVDFSSTAVANIPWKACAHIEEARLQKSKMKFERLFLAHRLVHLNVSHSSLRELPEFDEAIELKTLTARNNFISCVPKSIGLLKSLIVLSLDRNTLMTLPKSIGTLSSLSILSLSENQLQSLPREILMASDLVELNVSQNPSLHSLPRGLRKRLRALSTEGCYLQSS
jgi:leucine-rich repeat protein SHOC2